jgi:L-ascorbate metabolism protein UlaG (beta-lactamase superfamily)
MPEAGPPPPRRRRWLRALAVVFGAPLLLSLALLADAWTALGVQAEGARLARMEASPQWRDGRFRPPLPKTQGSMWTILRDALSGDQLRAPQDPGDIPRITPDPAALASAPTSGLRLTWLGHSSFLVDIDGIRVLTDPVWGERASPLSLLGPARFYPPLIPLAELPPIDAVVISHDHYDHLDEPTIRALAGTTRFVVPLGIGADLEYWGVPAADIVELDWWERQAVGAVELVATPARHFSGRGLTDADQTLCTGWALVGGEHRVFYSGDTAMFPGFAEIGARLGPFDATLVESGAYSGLWADVHLGPEQAVAAHVAARGDLLIPVHWGTFNLASHAWTEPAERILVAAERAGVSLAIPRPGESVEPADPPPIERWWPEIPWQTAEEAPVVSSGLASPR